MIQMETPPTGGGSLQKQVNDLQSYLHRTQQQLQWAFETLEAGTSGGRVLERRGMPQELLQSLPMAPGQLSPEQIFLNLKNLIIKSADIVKAYSDEMKKTFDGEYLAISEFGTYKEKTSQEIRVNSVSVQQLFSYTGQIQQDLDALELQTAAASGYIRTGCLEEGAFPIYGLEIGQSNRLNGQEVFRKYARFTADRLSFYDASDVEVAYISDYRLYITNAQVAGVLNLGGRFRVSYDGGLAFQWTGGNG